VRPEWLDRAFLHHDIIRRAEKEGAGHHPYTETEQREAIIHIRGDMTIAISLLATACKFLSQILLILRLLALLLIGFLVWRIVG